MSMEMSCLWGHFEPLIGEIIFSSHNFLIVRCSQGYKPTDGHAVVFTSDPKITQTEKTKVRVVLLLWVDNMGSHNML